MTAAVAIALAALILLDLVWKDRRAAWAFPACEWLPDSERRSGRGPRLQQLARVGAAVALAAIAASPGPVAAESAPADSAEMIVLDCSSSMTADDFQPRNRLEAAAAALVDHVRGRPSGQFGVIAFAASPRLAAPVTPDRESIVAALRSARTASFHDDGTAIGAAISSAINRLRSGPWKERRILLVTDGVDNRGPVSPLDAADLARALGIAVDVIGLGTAGLSRFLVPLPGGGVTELRARIEIDSRGLEAVAARAGGTFRGARNAQELRAALAALAAPPRTIPVPARSRRWLQLLALAALGLLVLELLVGRFLLPELPP
jgi:Ca-activated chloride channel family protein